MDKEEYEVGYKKPPKSSQFKPGQSGNKKGRPIKENRHIDQIIEEELNTYVHIVEDGKRIKIKKKDVFIKAMVNDGIKGVTHARKYICEKLDKEPPVEKDTDNVVIYIPDNGRDPDLLPKDVKTEAEVKKLWNDDPEDDL